jgi:hypothetical protein
MVSPGMADPTIEVMRGEAMVEVDYLPKLARLDVLEHGADAALLKEGLYRFNADRGSISVFGGKTQVSDGDGKMREIGKGKELVLTDARLKTVGFDTKAPDELYRWSAARAGYLAEANESSARTVYVAGGWGPYGWGPGWAWNPYFGRWIFPEPVRISVLLARLRGVCALLWAWFLRRPRVHSRIARRDRRGTGFSRNQLTLSAL